MKRVALYCPSETSFVEPEWWAACEDADLRPVVADRALSVWVGLDATGRTNSYPAMQRKRRIALLEGMG